MSHLRSSEVPLAHRKYTLTGSFCPCLCALSSACRTTAPCKCDTMFLR
jgi:hypothetical protein